MVVGEGVRLLVPLELAADAVGDGRDKLPAQAEVGADLLGVLLGGVPLLGEVPLELVDEGDVADVDVQLDDDALVFLLAEEVVAVTENRKKNIEKTFIGVRELRFR